MTESAKRNNNKNNNNNNEKKSLLEPLIMVKNDNIVFPVSVSPTAVETSKLFQSFVAKKSTAPKLKINEQIQTILLLLRGRGVVERTLDF